MSGSCEVRDEGQRAWSLEFKVGARRQLHDITKRNPQIAEGIVRKIQWLVSNANAINHERLRGREEYSLHVGQFRVLYQIDWEGRRITITWVGAHNAGYRR